MDKKLKIWIKIKNKYKVNNRRIKLKKYDTRTPLKIYVELKK